MQSFLISILTISFFLLSSIGVFAEETTKAKANKDDAIHGYHAFGFAELSVASSLRQHAYKKYSKSLTGAIALEKAIHNLFNTPSKASMEAARKAWIKARNPYLKSEVLRFIFPEIDQWEGKVNAWPIDEGFIDYVALDNKSGQDNPYSTINIIANTKPVVNGSTIDASSITPELIANVLHQYDGIESNVAAGYHAIEFLLWGQDLAETGAGNRPWTDYSLTDCSNGNCERRRAYLQSLMTLLISDLRFALNRWEREGDLTIKLITGDPDRIMGTIIEGIVEFIQAELAGERMKLALTLHDPEEEHDCFSDTTHLSHWNNLKGVEKILFSLPNMPNNIRFIDMLPQRELIRESYTNARTAVSEIMKSGKAGQPFDQLILENNKQGNQIVQNAIEKLAILSLTLTETRSHYK